MNTTASKHYTTGSETFCHMRFFGEMYIKRWKAIGKSDFLSRSLFTFSFAMNPIWSLSLLLASVSAAPSHRLNETDNWTRICNSCNITNLWDLFWPRQGPVSLTCEEDILSMTTSSDFEDWERFLEIEEAVDDENDDDWLYDDGDVNDVEDEVFEDDDDGSMIYSYSFKAEEAEGFYTESTRIRYVHNLYKEFGPQGRFDRVLAQRRVETLKTMLLRFENYELMSITTQPYNDQRAEKVLLELRYDSFDDLSSHETVVFSVSSVRFVIENVKASIEAISSDIAKARQNCTDKLTYPFADSNIRSHLAQTRWLENCSV